MAVVMLPLFLYALLRTTPVQNYLTDRATSYLSKELGTTVQVGAIDISWFLNLVLVDVKVLDKHGVALFGIHELKASVEKLSFKKHILTVKKIALNKADINLIYYKADSCLNLQFFIDYFSSADTTPSTSAPWTIRFRSIELKDSHFAMRDERYMSPTKGIDFSDMDLSSLNMKLNDIHFHGDSIMANIVNIAAREKSGFNLHQFSARAIVSPRGFSTDQLKIITDNSDLSMNLSMLYRDWSGFDNFLDSVSILSTISPSELDMRDIVYFAPDIEGMNEHYHLSGRLKGTVSSFTAKNMNIFYSDGTRFSGDIRMVGLPDIEETFVQLKIGEFRTDNDDILKFTLPGVNNTIPLPKEVSQLGNIIVKGNFTGFYNDFVSNATFITDAGNVATDLLLRKNKEQKIIEYNGHIQASAFNLGKVFGITEIGSFDLDASVNGKGLTADKADLTLVGNASNIELMGNTLNNLKIDGSFRKHKFDGVLTLKDELAQLHFNGSVDLADSIPAFDFKADLQNARLTRLNLWDRDTSDMLSTQMNLNFKGNTLDNLLGELKFENTHFSEKGRSLDMKSLTLITELQKNGKRMSLASDFADAEFNGQYTFDDLSEYLTFVFTDYLPALALVTPKVTRDVKGSFDYAIHLKNTVPITSIFMPDLEIDKNTVISGEFNPSIGLINVNGKSPHIRLNGFSFRDWTLSGRTESGELSLRMDCSSVDQSDAQTPDPSVSKLENLLLLATARNDSVMFRLKWNDKDTADYNKADIGGTVSFSSYPTLVLKFDPSSMIINDTMWNFASGSAITIDTNSVYISKLGIVSENQSIVVDGRISHDPLDKLDIQFNNFNISQFDPLTKSWGIDFDGLLNGNLSISNVYEIPLITASLLLKKMGVNHELLGDAEIKSEWDTRSKSIKIDTKIAYHGNVSDHYPLFIKGSIYPDREHDNFDLSIDVDNLKLAVLQPFFTDIFSKMRGWGSGKLALKGDFSDPILDGSIKLMRAEFLVDYLHVSYSLVGNIDFAKDLISFKEIQLADSMGNTGVASGNIRHKDFDDWNLDINVKTNNLFVLNTNYSPDEAYYGKAKALGNMSLTGPINDLKLRVKASSGKGTEVFVPINYAVNITDNDFITYVRHDTLVKENQSQPSEPSNLSLQLGLDVTKDANMEIILPYSMGNIKVRGDGLIDMGIDTRGDYSMHGIYTMDRGSFLFNLQNIFSRNFEIKKGSTITFNGSLSDADINLQAVYRIKTTLSGLGSIPVEEASKRIPVDCIVSLTNSLYNPDIRFSIAMPETDAVTQRLVYGAIDTSNAVAMNQQMISLLVLNSFTSTGENAGISASGLGLSSFGMVSGQLNNWLSKISKDFDVGVNYRPGDQMSAQELELALSTQLFNDRVVIDGNFGRSTASSQTASANQNANQWIGDVNVEVKITEDGRFRMKAFNRTNTSLDPFSGQSPYTQGVGVLYRKDFDSFRDLFRKQRKAVITE
ncbi:MAG: translocation/assembly module TamB domain-containing protein [Bacteroidetes bacterium]|nr:translocation/assembly module TamB domain-containing protein [Bacteroidota bacterium]